MNIVVIVRPAPGWEKPRFNMQTGEPEVSPGTAVGLLAWGEGTWVLNPSDRNALDLALTLAENEADTRITALALAVHDPAAATEALYAALARGAQGAVLLNNPDYGSDPAVTATVLAAAIGKIGADAPVDLVLTGAEAPDGGPDPVAPMLAEALGWGQLTGVRRLTSGADKRMQGEQAGDSGTQTLETRLPAVVSVARQVSGLARYTHLGRELVAYRKQGIDTWDAARLGLDEAAGTLTPRITIRRNALADAPTGERLAGPVEESVAVVLQGLKAQGRI